MHKFAVFLKNILEKMSLRRGTARFGQQYWYA